ncbi:hypothetical protein H2200_008239 [Cladophialophora chaetospira]|uniref:AB hydrolase-1 domain-containing protein n=1 Tax=Cladophialophora chaetospira TaxID=386627 RepID=A0AA39CG86_9EURO|nr:hypothetical protein H2200_008239 [Cladophialophora chaetospira]
MIESNTYSTAPIHILKVHNSTFAYRLFGHSNPHSPDHEDDVPLLLPTHFRSRLDFWDPALINALAARRRILLLDNHGSADPAALKGSARTARTPGPRGAKAGGSPATNTSFLFWAREILAFIQALNIDQIDILGFSMGGFMAQMLYLVSPPGLIRRLILAGTSPSSGEGVSSGDMTYFQNLVNAATDGEIKAGFLAGFFGLSSERQQCGEKWWGRITSSSSMWPFVSTNDIDGQISAMMRWYGLTHRDEGSYDRLAEIQCPVLILCGQRDKLVPEQNSILLWQKISEKNPDVHIHMYPEVRFPSLRETALT